MADDPNAKIRAVVAGAPAAPTSSPSPQPVVDVVAAQVATPVVGGPVHTHTVTAAGLIAIVAGVGLMIAAPHLGPSATMATSTGIGLVALGAGGTTFGKSPAIP